MKDREHSRQIKHICLIFAMEEEASPLVAKIGLRQKRPCWPHHYPLECYEGKIQCVRITLVYSGSDPRHGVSNVGPVAATFGAVVALQTLAPDILISCGTAGGFASGGSKVGSVYVSRDHCIFHDRKIPLPGYDSAGIGYFPVTNTAGMAAALGLRSGIISTGSSLLLHDGDIDFMLLHRAAAKEMEAAAVAWVSQQLHFEFFAVKSITNLLDLPESSQKQFSNNFGIAVAALTDSIESVIHFCVGKTIEDLAG